MSKVLNSRIFRFLVCLILVASFLINLSPLKAEAFVVEATTVSAVGLTLYLYLLWSGFVVPPPDIGIYQDLDDSFRHYLDDLGIDESSWASDADDLDDEWESSDSSDGDGTDSSGSVTINVGQTLRNLMRAFVCGGLVKASIDLLPEYTTIKDTWSVYGTALLPEFPTYDGYSYQLLLENDGAFNIIHSTTPFAFSGTIDGKGNGVSISACDFIVDYVYKSTINNWDPYNSSWSRLGSNSPSKAGVGSKAYSSMPVWSNFDVTLYSDPYVIRIYGSEPIIAENKYLVPSAIMGSIAGGLQNGTLAEEDVNLPPILDISSVIKSGMANYHEDMVQAAQNLIDGKISHEDFQEQLAYNEDTGEDIPGVIDPTVPSVDPIDPSDPTTSTVPSDGPVQDIKPYGLDLKDYFPFCIPFDIYEFFSVLIAEPSAPQFHWELQDLSGNTYSIDVDLSPWDSFAATFRRMQLLLFIVGLAAASRKFIKW